MNYTGGKDTLWWSIDENIRQDTKNNLLKVLAYPNDIIRNTAADAISIIFEIEFDKDTWNDLIPMLAENTKHTDNEIKKSAIYCLGQICEKMKEKTNIPQQFLENILMAICIGMEDQVRDDIKAIAVQAFYDSLGFLQPLL